MTPDQIKQELKWLTERQIDLQEDYYYRKSILDRRTQEIQNLCEHTDKTYHPDPSGNNDSEWKCNICGKTAKKL